MKSTQLEHPNDDFSTPFSRSLGKKIKQARKEAGLSQKELGGFLKVSDKTVSSYEVGRAMPSFQMLHSISRLLHKKIDYFDDSTGEDVTLESLARELDEIKQLLKQGQ